jgi:hypothetical protein
MRFWEVFFVMMEKHKRRRRERRKVCTQGEKPKKSEKEKHTHKDISPVHNLFIIPSALIYLWEG